MSDDDELIEILKNPKNTITSLKKFVAFLRDNDVMYDLSNVRRIYQGNTEQVRPVPKTSQIKIKAITGTVGQLQMDLMDVQKYTTQNKSIKYLFNVIDVYSRYLWSFPIKNKEPDTVKPLLESVIKEVQTYYPENTIIVQSDDGSEFKGVVTKSLNKLEIRQMRTTYKRNMSIVERVHKSFWSAFRNYILLTGKNDFLKILPDFVKNYNNLETYFFLIVLK